MLKDENNFFLALLWTAYFAFLELTSLGQTSEVSPCIIVSQEQAADNQSGYQACAPVHEAVFRMLSFIWDNANHNNIIAFGTVMIALFTLTLWWSTSRLWRAARQDFIATHRPHVIVRSIDFPSVSYDEEPPREKVLICVVNNGVADAILVGFEADIYRHFPGDSYWPSTARIKTIPPVRLKGGERHYITVPGKRPYDEAENADEANGKARLVARGRLVYEDGNGVRRETGFCRQLDRKRQTYVASDDPSQEYQD